MPTNRETAVEKLDRYIEAALELLSDKAEPLPAIDEGAIYDPDDPEDEGECPVRCAMEGLCRVRGHLLNNPPKEAGN